MASNVLSGSNQEGASANSFAVAAVILTPFDLMRLINAVLEDDDNDDGDVYSSAGAEHCIIPRATSIDCTISRLAGARLFFHQAILLCMVCLAVVAREHSNAATMGVLCTMHCIIYGKTK